MSTLVLLNLSNYAHQMVYLLNSYLLDSSIYHLVSQFQYYLSVYQIVITKNEVFKIKLNLPFLKKAR